MNLIHSNSVTMSSLEIADLVGSRHDNVRVTIERLVDRKVIQPPALQEVKNDRGQGVATYMICKRDSFVIVAQLSPEFTAALVDRWQELESRQSISIPDFSNPAAAARAWAEQFEIAQGVMIERDQAVATKAEIGARREATAMNTASQAVKKVAALEVQLDHSKEYCTIKRMEMLKHGQKFEWRRLKSTCTEMGVPAIDVFDQNYGTVKSYHVDVWLEAYGIGLDD